MGTISMKIFVMILILSFIWIKPSTATKHPTTNTKKRINCNIFAMLCFKKVCSINCGNKLLDYEKKTSEIFAYYEKLQTQAHIINIITSYLNLKEYVKMNKLNKKSRDINLKFAKHHTVIHSLQYHMFLTKYPIEKENIEMIRRYASRLTGLSIRSKLHSEHFSLRTRAKWIKHTNKIEYKTSNFDLIRQKQVPAVIIFMSKTNEIEYVIQLSQWKCKMINTTRQNAFFKNVPATQLNQTLMFVPKTPHKIHPRLIIQYEAWCELPYYIEVDCGDGTYFKTTEGMIDFYPTYEDNYIEERFPTGETLLLFFTPFCKYHK